jgi:hypothetical protein
MSFAKYIVFVEDLLHTLQSCCCSSNKAILLEAIAGIGAAFQLSFEPTVRSSDTCTYNLHALHIKYMLFGGYSQLLKLIGFSLVGRRSEASHQSLIGVQRAQQWSQPRVFEPRVNSPETNRKWLRR